MATMVNMDLYDMLGVPENASQDAIRKAYRELAKKYHPDKTGGDADAEERLKEINGAYNILKNAEKRKEYDEQRSLGAFQGFSEGADFSDIFSSFFGGAGPRPVRPRSAARPGNDLEARVRITLNDVVEGTRKTLRIHRAETCGECNGSGAAPGTSPVACSECGGAGQVSRGSSFYQVSQPCPRCQGSGQVNPSPCLKCSGNGRVKATREISVSIPAGVTTGTRLRISGEGEAGIKGGPRGDLYVRVDIGKDPFFECDGKNIVVEAPITFAEAALGGKVTVPTLTGVAKLTVEPGTQSGAQLRMRGMGLPPMGGEARGDEIVRIIVEMPRKLSGEQKRLLREFSGEYEPDSHPLRDAFRALLKRLRGESD